ncbi:hypothetical protein HMPREF1218_1241 [Hoylesella pleuritidis F0068]|uniref:Uncharacterized protein n=1 Tax=Hoylesella pleuritidis F0068 TaxID=1081904 RepID=U2KKU9_9BACT|nr:hypothetical protein HMPREF1218_1241 [Hoylesella pleuritidis F0068]
MERSTKNRIFAALFGVIAGRKMSGLVMLRWNDNKFNDQVKWI